MDVARPARSAAVPLRRRWHDASSERTRRLARRYGAAATAGRTASCRIAAHAHADALSVEVRYGGVDVLADPGTYCYHGEPEWRSYFRSTIAHNTVEVAGRSSPPRRPVPVAAACAGREIDVPDAALNWTAEHDGYAPPPAGLAPALGPARSRGARHRDHRRDRRRRARRPDRLPSRPAVRVSLDGAFAELAWPDAVTPGAARLSCPAGLEWSLHRGETDPILGWYSDGIGRKTPAVTLVGTGQCRRDTPLITRLEFIDMETDAYAEVPQ